jgi:hypothetical protein
VAFAKTEAGTLVNPDRQATGTGRRGYLMILTVTLLAVVGIASTIRLWPPSDAQQRQRAVDACKDSVEQATGTSRVTRWDGFAVRKDGDGYQVAGAYVGSSGAANVVCSVDASGNVTDVSLSGPRDS